MNRAFRRRIGRFALAALGALALGACDRQASEADRAENGVVSFSIPALGPTKAAVAAWRPILDDMTSATGLRIKPYASDADLALVEAMRHGKTDAGLFSNAAAVQTVHLARGEVFARTAPIAGAAPETSILIVNAKRPLTLTRVLKCDRTLTIGFAESPTPAGRLAPLAYLFAPRDIDPRACFKAVRRASQKANLLAVSEGRLDLAAVGSATLISAAPASQQGGEAVRVIWRSPPLPTDPLVWRSDLDPAIKERLRQFLLTYGQGAGPDAARQRADLARIGIGGFAAADDSHLLPIREMEAAEAWVQARQSRDARRLAAAAETLDDIRAERQALEARTRTPAAEQ